jgi:hypothetical protein
MSAILAQHREAFVNAEGIFFGLGIVTVLLIELGLFFVIGIWLVGGFRSHYKSSSSWWWSR